MIAGREQIPQLPPTITLKAQIVVSANKLLPECVFSFLLHKPYLHRLKLR
jgi:hypothetical protein